MHSALSVDWRLEKAAAIIILVPVFMPVTLGLGIDPVHFGIVTVLALVLGMLTPPVGLVVFVVSLISDLRLERLAVAVAPFLMIAIAVLATVALISELGCGCPGCSCQEPWTGCETGELAGHDQDACERNRTRSSAILRHMVPAPVRASWLTQVPSQ